jgi:hypothetical protein
LLQRYDKGWFTEQRKSQCGILWGMNIQNLTDSYPFPTVFGNEPESFAETMCRLTIRDVRFATSQDF